MNKETSEMINLYIDGELDRKEEALLFVLLLQDKDAREYFRSLQILKMNISETTEEIPDRLEEKIVKSITSKQRKKVQLQSGSFLTTKLPYAFAVILLILCTYIFLKFDSYQDRFEIISNQLQVQNKTIEMLYNSIPAVEVTGQLKNKITITPKL